MLVVFTKDMECTKKKNKLFLSSRISMQCFPEISQFNIDISFVATKKSYDLIHIFVQKML